MDERLHRALSEFGLLHYADQLIESEIFDVATLESLTEDDWQEVIADEEDRARLQDVVKMIKLKERTKPRVKPSWRPAGKSTSTQKKKAASPSEEGIRLEKHRVHLRKQREIIRNPTATAAELDWANTSDPHFGGDPSPPVSFTGSRWLLKVADKVRVIKPVTKLWKCIGAMNTKQFPQAGLMSGMVGEVKDFIKDGLVIKFDNATLSMPADALELLSTKHVTPEEVDHIRNHKNKRSASRTKRKTANGTESGSPEVIGRTATKSPKVFMHTSPATPPPTSSRPSTANGERPPWGANTNAWEARRSTNWKKNPTKTNLTSDPATDGEDDFVVHDMSDSKRPRTASYRKKHPIRAPSRSTNGNSKESHLAQQVQDLQMQLTEAHAQLSESNQKVELQSQAQAEVKDLLKGFSSIAQTLASSSTMWAEQLAETHPKSAALAEELRNANQSLAHRLSILSTELVV
eukprot:TRINITY_DN19483_c0_g1_i1.p1 TRINITY_DN19483_c0_g1~~TRINITY_DN19483_c0_g1_i1.p1  ORF type:complete len:462 (+),score=77.04 TRINITY_DN19483_c0_g1_i1:43-1428(+)